MPDHISRGMVRCSTPATNSTMTISSKEVMKAKRAPEITPGRISGKVTRKKVCRGVAPRLAAALARLSSKPMRVAVTVMTTKGTPKAVWARMTPVKVCARLTEEKKKNMPAAEMIKGTIIGEIRTPMISPRAGTCDRLRPRAARVPRIVASSAEAIPMMKELRIERSQLLEEKSSSYQRSE